MDVRQGGQSLCWLLELDRLLLDHSGSADGCKLCGLPEICEIAALMIAPSEAALLDCCRLKRPTWNQLRLLYLIAAVEEANWNQVRLLYLIAAKVAN